MMHTREVPAGGLNAGNRFGRAISYPRSGERGHDRNFQPHPTRQVHSFGGRGARNATGKDPK